jgi:hypothetical protein
MNLPSVLHKNLLPEQYIATDRINNSDFKVIDKTLLRYKKNHTKRKIQSDGDGICYSICRHNIMFYWIIIVLRQNSMSAPKRTIWFGLTWRPAAK